MGDMTFEEAYRKTGRILNITLSSSTKKAPPILVNYITAPNVVISSAVVASAGKYLINQSKLNVPYFLMVRTNTIFRASSQLFLF